jgi:hypothetical protein
MQKSNIIILLLVGLLLNYGCITRPIDRSSVKQNIIVLKNNKIELGIYPRFGGRVVWLSQPEAANILKTSAAVWQDTATNLPVLAKLPKDKWFKWPGYLGQIVWIGPQSRRWPPDPYQLYGDFKVIVRRDDYLKLRGPKSEFTGLQLEKEFWIKANGQVKFKVTAKNISSKPVTWDLWLNLRLDPFARCYVPLANGENSLKFKNKENKKVASQQYTIIDGFCTFLPKKNPPGKIRNTGKLFIYPKTGLIAGFTKDFLLTINFPMIPQNKIFPEQSLVELYLGVLGGKNFPKSLLELEHHSAFKTLKPGQTMSVEESWSVRKYHGENSPKAHIKFLKSVLAVN